MSTPFAMIRDINGFNSFILTPGDYQDKFQTNLAVGVAQQITVPTLGARKYVAIFGFEPGMPVWVAVNNTAAVPGGTFANTNSELNPAGLFVQPGDTISFITVATTAEVGVKLYAV